MVQPPWQSSRNLSSCRHASGTWGFGWPGSFERRIQTIGPGLRDFYGMGFYANDEIPTNESQQRISMAFLWNSMLKMWGVSTKKARKKSLENANDPLTLEVSYVQANGYGILWGLCGTIQWETNQYWRDSDSSSKMLQKMLDLTWFNHVQ